MGVDLDQVGSRRRETALARVGQNGQPERLALLEVARAPAADRVSANGNLTSERLPVTITAEKTFAFGGGAIISRRRDALERLTAGIYLVNGFAIDLGVTSHRLAWPNQDPANDLRGSEVTFTLGGQYTLSW